jgi:predicted nucleic acid-binding protein
MSPKIYLDTNILDNLTKNDNRTKITKNLFSRIENRIFEAYYSPTVIEELLATKDKKQGCTFNKILNDKIFSKQCIKPICVNLPMLKNVLKLADAYAYKNKVSVTDESGRVKKLIWQKSQFSKGKSQAKDRIHIATATVNRINIFVTWNTKEFIRNGNIPNWVNVVNKRMGYSKIEFYSPETLLIKQE